MTRVAEVLRAVVIVAALMVGASIAHAQSVSPVDAATRAELIAAREAVWRAYFQGDSLKLLQLLPERMIAMEEDRTTIIRNARSFAREGNKYLGITFTKDEFFVNGNTAVVWSNYTVRTANAKGVSDERSGRAIELFVRVGGRWINPHWHLDETR